MPTGKVKYALWLVGIIAALLIIWYLWLSKEHQRVNRRSLP
jgi:hypothetical protein